MTVASALTGVAFSTQAASPAAARLSGGGSVVAWVDKGLVSARVLDNSGTPIGDVISVATATPSSVAVAGLANGEWIVAWDAVTLPAATPTAQRTTVQFRRYSATGALLQDTTTVAGPVYGVDAGMQAVGTPDGGFTVAFAAHDVTGAPGHIFAQRYQAGGSPLGGLVTLSARPGEQQQPRLVALPDSSTLLVWLQQSGGAAIFMRRIDAAGLPAGGETQLASSPSGASTLGARVLPSGNVAVAWTTVSRVSWQVFDLSGTARTAQGDASVPFSAGGPAHVAVVASAAGNGFLVLVDTYFAWNRGSGQHLLDYEVGADGLLLSTKELAVASVYSVSDITGNATGPAAAGFGIAADTDGHFVYAWESASGVGVAQLSAAGQ
ncbi:hypothetical protein ACPWT1_08140 [Ramlibacter sp. MMS24-I3-19]|uniref:hypothetical protein n=1 Tax=Ramlibacter sp. MMS24-I3-19 TaxID=3416606 RepID=UPI003CFF7540